jgi:hypothetical protein
MHPARQPLIDTFCGCFVGVCCAAGLETSSGLPWGTEEVAQAVMLHGKHAAVGGRYYGSAASAVAEAAEEMKAAGRNRTQAAVKARLDMVPPFITATALSGALGILVEAEAGEHDSTQLEDRLKALQDQLFAMLVVDAQENPGTRDSAGHSAAASRGEWLGGWVECVECVGGCLGG